METPSSTRRLTRSQAMAATAANTTTVVSKKFEESENKAGKSRNGNEQERSALFDITNDSPIVGVAMGSLETPSSSAMSKKRAIMNAVSKQLKTPGSGEALLRGQVKTLLQKVEEEAELSKLSVEYRPFLHLKGFVNNSPTGLLAPTPANTPHLSLSGNNGLPSSINSSPVEEKFLIPPQMVDGICDWKKEGEEIESEKSMVTRTLFLDFTDKLECENKEKITPGADDDDDDSSVWSIQANASSIKDEEEEEYDGEEEEEECDEYYEEEEEEEVCDGGLVDELCEGMSKISVNNSAKFSGKHTRFVYNSDGELEGVEVDEEKTSAIL